MATRTENALRRFAIAAAILAAGLSTVILLAPGGLGTPAPVRVTDGVSADLYRAIAGWTNGAPEWVRKLAELGGEASLVVLGLLLVSIWWTGRRRAPGQVAIAGLAAAGTVAAYLVSEAAKLMVDEERPCRVLGSSELACPPVGDWSFPSNHATLAAALAVGLALARPRLAALALSLAGVAAAARVLAGVHYPHDVLAGVVLGAAVVATVVVGLRQLADRLIEKASRTPVVGPLVDARGPADSEH